ncbi:MAG TPA: hypothetical protein VJB92_02995 [Candidatus Paceibacterota bacterium]
MKPFIVLITLVSFTAIAVFGFIVIIHSGGHSSCIARVFEGAPCPENNPVGYASFHISALKSFSSAVLNSFASAFLIAFLFFVFLISLAFISGIELTPISAFFPKLPVSQGKPLYQSRIFSWLSFLLNSPNFS